MLTVRQRILKWAYPLVRFAKKKHREKGLILFNQYNQKPQESFYSLKAISIQGKEISMEVFKGKKILIVNVASDCGYTGQYDELEKLYQQHQRHLIVLGFPSNNFKNQESGSDQEIEQFCKVNYGVSFPLFKKQPVIGSEQNEIYHWLTHKNRNGWNDQPPVWNFAKYLINEEGSLQAFYGPAISPFSIKL
jgi:glutathione peroxidase